MLSIVIRGITYIMDVIYIPDVCYIRASKKSSHSYSFSLFFYDSKFICERHAIRSKKELNIDVQYWCDMFLNDVVQNSLK